LRLMCRDEPTTLPSAVVSERITNHLAVMPFTQEWTGAVQAFNARLGAGGATEEHHQAPEHPTPEWLAKIDGTRLYQEFYVATQGHAVRGAFALKHQDFSFFGATRTMAQFRQPLSEAIVNRSFAAVGFRLLRDALKRQPLLYSLGIGSFEDPFARFLSAAKWRLHGVPFLFKITQPGRFLRLAPVLRRSPVLAAASSLAAVSGLGWVGIKASQLRSRWTPNESFESADFSDFGPWADELWEESKRSYAFSAVRDSAVLKRLYPSSSSRFIRIRVKHDSAAVGWAILLDTSMRNNRYFGNLRVGSIVDCLARPAHEHAVIAAATRMLEMRGVDVIVSNQGHYGWVKALKQCGFLSGPTNFIFAASPQLADLLTPFDQSSSRFHLNRGDGSGPIHL
jgi:hypothetical protein